MEKCKHHAGWVSIKDQTIFLKDEVKIGFDKKRYGQQVLMRCNMPDCNAVRFAYFKNGKFITFGRIKRNVVE